MIEWYSENTNQILIKNLEEIGFRVSEKIKKNTGKFNGKTFVLTGTLSNYTRQNATKIIEDSGGIVTTSVSKIQIIYFLVKTLDLNMKRLKI